jgi:aminoglycoside/choline kinase family phosphotransferase
MVLADRTLAMVDIQDARWGPDTYDLASLIHDAYVDLDPDWVEPMIQCYLKTARLHDGHDLRHRLHVVGAQRMIKALGTFGYQLEVVGSNRYLGAIPRTLMRLDRMLTRNEKTSSIHDAFQALDLFQGTP